MFNVSARYSDGTWSDHGPYMLFDVASIFAQAKIDIEDDVEFIAVWIAADNGYREVASWGSKINQYI